MNTILIIRLSAIGDVVMASPLIRALRARYPEARLVWLAQPEVRELLEVHPELDEVIVWPRGQWRRLWRERRYLAWWRELRDFLRRLRAVKADLAIDLQGLLKSGLWTRFSGAAERVSLGGREGSRLLMTRVVPRGGDPRRISSEYLYLAEQLGLPTGAFALDLALAPEDEVFARQFIGEQRLEDGYAVICPFTTRAQKHWFEDYWVELASRLRETLGLKVVMLGGPGDRAGAERIHRAAGGALVNAVGHTRLRQAAALIKHARVLVGVDTGLTHMAHAFQRPAVCLFGSTRPYLDPANPRGRVIYHDLECAPCKRRPSCGGAYTCMRGITPQEVMEVLEPLLEADGR